MEFAADAVSIVTIVWRRRKLKGDECVAIFGRRGGGGLSQKNIGSKEYADPWFGQWRACEKSCSGSTCCCGGCRCCGQPRQSQSDSIKVGVMHVVAAHAFIAIVAGEDGPGIIGRILVRVDCQDKNEVDLRSSFLKDVQSHQANHDSLFLAHHVFGWRYFGVASKQFLEFFIHCLMECVPKGGQAEMIYGFLGFKFQHDWIGSQAGYVVPVFQGNAGGETTGGDTIDDGDGCYGCLHDEVVVVILKRGGAGIVTPEKRAMIGDDGPIAVTTRTTEHTTAIADHGECINSLLGCGLGNALR